MVYDNYQFLAIGFGATERASDCVVSLAVSPKGVALSFYYGATLPDPDTVLLGEGKQNRFVRLESAATLADAGSTIGPERTAGSSSHPHPCPLASPRTCSAAGATMRYCLPNDRKGSPERDCEHPPANVRRETNGDDG